VYLLFINSDLIIHHPSFHQYVLITCELFIISYLLCIIIIRYFMRILSYFVFIIPYFLFLISYLLFHISYFIFHYLTHNILLLFTIIYL